MARIKPKMPTVPALLIAVALVLLLPAPASAQSINVPPGQSEADQYFEVVPEGTGNKSLDNSAEPGEVLTPSQIAELEGLGEDGSAAAQTAAATAPGDSGGGGKGGDGSGRGAGSAEISAAGGVAPSRDGLGGMLWLVMAGTAAAVGGYAIARRRSRGGS
jgi:hypothetical protein